MSEVKQVPTMEPHGLSSGNTNHAPRPHPDDLGGSLLYVFRGQMGLKTYRSRRMENLQKQTTQDASLMCP